MLGCGMRPSVLPSRIGLEVFTGLVEVFTGLVEVFRSSFTEDSLSPAIADGSLMTRALATGSLSAGGD